MKRFELIFPRKVIFGNYNEVNKITEGKKVLLVTTKNFYTTKKVWCDWTYLTCPEPYIPPRLMDKGCRFDYVVGLGGGSALDVAKYIGATYNKKIILIPTTFSGAEMTHEVVLKRDGKKWADKQDKYVADVVIYDEKLLKSLPKKFRGFSAIDALSQMSESRTGKRANLITNNFNEAAKYMAMGFGKSMLIGLAFGNSGTHLIHALSYPLSNRGIPHGEAISIVANRGWEFVDKKVRTYPMFVKNINIEPEVFAEEVWKNNQGHLKNCPKKVTKNDLINIYRKIREDMK